MDYIRFKKKPTKPRPPSATTKSEQLIDTSSSNSKEDYGLCPPPLNAQEGLNVLIEHFLGKGWYVTMPLNQEQVNTQAVYEILEKYSKKRG